MTNSLSKLLYNTEFLQPAGVHSPLADYTVFASVVLCIFLSIVVFFLVKVFPKKKLLHNFFITSLLFAVAQVLYYIEFRYQIPSLNLMFTSTFLVSMFFVSRMIKKTVLKGNAIYFVYIAALLSAITSAIFQIRILYFIYVIFIAVIFAGTLVSLFSYMKYRLKITRIAYIIIFCLLFSAIFYTYYLTLVEKSDFHFFLFNLHLGMFYSSFILFFINDKDIFERRQIILINLGILCLVGSFVLGWLFFNTQNQYITTLFDASLTASQLSKLYLHNLSASVIATSAFSLVILFALIYLFFQTQKNRQLNSLNSYNRKIFDAVGVPLVVFSGDRLIHYNHETLIEFGYTSEELNAITPKTLFAEHEVLDAELSAVSAEISHGFNSDCRRKDSSLFPANISISLHIQDDKPLYIMVIKNIMGILQGIHSTEFLNSIFKLLIREDFRQNSIDLIGRLIERYFSAVWLYVYLRGFEGYYKYGRLPSGQGDVSKKFYFDSNEAIDRNCDKDQCNLFFRITTSKQNYGFIGIGIPLAMNTALTEFTLNNIASALAQFIETEMLFRQLQNSETTYRAVIEHALTGIYLMQENRIVYANRKFMDITGYTQEDIDNGLDPAVLAAEDSTIKVHPDPNTARRIDENTGIQYSYKGVRKDRKPCWFSVYESIVEYNQKPAVLSHIMDINAQIEMEQQKDKMTALLIQQQKMDTMRNLVAGISHEYNNIFAIIKGYYELILYSMDDTENMRAKNDLENIAQAVDRGIKITNRMHIFARHEKITKKPIDLRDFFKTLDPVFGSMTRKKSPSISLKIDVDPLAGILVTDEVTIEEIIYNLIKNSVDAVDEKGAIQIKVFRPDSGHVRIDISDDGCGIPDENKPRIFDPFFTTKDPQQATGLGLYIVYQLVKMLEASIEIDSRIGRGTTVKILFNL